MKGLFSIVLAFAAAGVLAAPQGNHFGPPRLHRRDAAQNTNPPVAARDVDAPHRREAAPQARGSNPPVVVRDIDAPHRRREVPQAGHTPPSVAQRDAPAQRRGAAAACSTPVKLSGNPFTGRKIYANKFYAAEVKNATAAITDATLAASAAKVAEVGTFLWIDTIARINAVVEDGVKDVGCDEIAAFVIYDLPGRDCAAKASNGELAVGTVSKYKSDYIDPIVAIFKKYPNTAIALIIEPDSLPNLVTNSNLQTCQDSAAGYREGVAYALKSLNLPNIAMYIDAGHGGWLGWDNNLKPGAKELATVYKNAGSPEQVRGFSTNVAGWNAWDLSPGEFSTATDGKYNKAQNEKLYVSMISPEFKSAGMPSQAIVDTGRNAVTGLRKEWGDWCNVKGAGFGVRPTTTTGSDLVDSFVWVKPGGESDGTSDSTAKRYDSFCGKDDAFKPSPEAGAWNQAYFEMLLKNAKPAF